MSVLQPSKNSVSLPKYSYQWITGSNGNIYYSGNVGINTRSDPQYNLDVSGTSNISGNTIIRGILTTIRDASFNGNLYIGQDIYIKNQKVTTTGSSSQWITGTNGNIYYNGNVGINMNRNPMASLDVSGNIFVSGNNNSLFFVNNLSCNIGTTDVYNAIYYPLRTIYDNTYWETTEIGCPSQTVTPTLTPNWIRLSKNGNRIYRYSNTTSFDSLSDLNSKKDIVIANYDRCFEIINSIELKRFTYDEDIVPDSKYYDDKYRLGFIAQDLETVFPKSVINALDTSGNTTLKSINIDQINMALYGCVKSLIQKISKIQNDNKELESKVTLLESQISDILQRL